MALSSCPNVGTDPGWGGQLLLDEYDCAARGERESAGGGVIPRFACHALVRRAGAQVHRMQPVAAVLFLVHGDALRDLVDVDQIRDCLLYTSPSPRDATLSRMPSSA